MENDSLEIIREVIAKNNTIAISGHQNPDGDCIGACLALAMSLRNMGKEPVVLLEPYGGKYDCIPGKELVYDYEKGYDAIVPDLFIALDCGEAVRLGAAEAALERAPQSIVIDHHQNNHYFGSLNFIDVQKSSASEIVFDLLNGYMPIDKEIASALYVGIIYDTGAFRHTSTSPQTMRAAGTLMEYGISFTSLYHTFFDSRSFSEMKLMGRAFDNARLYFDNRFIITTITLAEIAELKGSGQELDAIVNFLKGVNGTAMACFFYEKEEGVVKASFRCQDGYDVSALARRFGGGGHIKAAGCTFYGTIDDAIGSVMAEVEKLM